MNSDNFVVYKFGKHCLAIDCRWAGQVYEKIQPIQLQLLSEHTVGCLRIRDVPVPLVNWSLLSEGISEVWNSEIQKYLTLEIHGNLLALPVTELVTVCEVEKLSQYSIDFKFDVLHPELESELRQLSEAYKEIFGGAASRLDSKREREQSLSIQKYLEVKTSQGIFHIPFACVRSLHFSNDLASSSREIPGSRLGTLQIEGTDIVTGCWSILYDHSTSSNSACQVEMGRRQNSGVVVVLEVENKKWAVIVSQLSRIIEVEGHSTVDLPRIFLRDYSEELVHDLGKFYLGFECITRQKITVVEMNFQGLQKKLELLNEFSKTAS